MIVLTLAAVMTAGAVVPRDTTAEVRAGDRVVISNVSGEIRVEVWDRPLLALATQAGDPRGLTVSRSGNELRVHPLDRRGRYRGPDVDIVVRIPSTAPVEIQGRSVDVHVVGVGGGVRARIVSGDIDTEDTAGVLDLSTMDGKIRVVRARGAVSARSRSDDVSLTDVEGVVDVGSGNGNIRLDGITTGDLRAETWDGDVFYRGGLVRGGTYRISVHDGDAVLVLPERSGATVSVATFDGEFSSDLPLTMQGRARGGVVEFVMGDGGAVLEVKAFDGDIRLNTSGR